MLTVGVFGDWTNVYMTNQLLFSNNISLFHHKPPTAGMNHTDIKWNKDEVFQYLMDYYAPYNLPTKDPKKLQWPIGNYGFVKTKVGCPEGFNSWKRTQDTENYRPSNAFDGDWDRYWRCFLKVGSKSRMHSNA